MNEKIDLMSLKTEAFSEIKKHNPQNLPIQDPFICDIDIYQCPFCLNKNSDIARFLYQSVYDPNKPQLDIKACKGENCMKSMELSLSYYLTNKLKLPYQCTYLEDYYLDPKQENPCHLREIKIYRNNACIILGSKCNAKVYEVSPRDFSDNNPGKLDEIYKKIQFPMYYPQSLKNFFESRLFIQKNL